MTDANDLRDRLKEELENLQAARDDLRVRLHLGKAEIRDRWEQLEKTWEHAEAKLKVLRNEARENAEDVGQALRLVADEIKEGYEHLRRLI